MSLKGLKVRIPHLRWFLCFLLFLATTLCFLDRQVLSVLAPQICTELEMSDVTYGYVTTAFLVSYALMFLMGGKLVDWLGTRWGLGLSVAFWSLSSAVHGFVYTPLQLALARCCLGMGEGACFPGAVKAAAEWFPKKERALATGIAIGGASLGGVMAPPFAVWCSNALGWHWAFFLTGFFGFIWVVLWFLFYHHPRKSPFITEKEANHIAQDSFPAASMPTAISLTLGENRIEESEVPKISFWQLLSRRDVWGLAFARFLFDPVFYLYMFWIPKYLASEKGLPLETVAKLAWIPFLALGISNVLGGFVSDRLVRWGIEPLKARKGVMAMAALATMASGLAAFAPNAYFAIGMMAILMFAHGFWITNYVTLISDRFHGSVIGTVMGITGMVGSIGAMFANTATGYIAQNFSYFPIWIASGCLYPLAMIVILLTIKRVRV